MHQGNIFSFSSDDQFERAQQNNQDVAQHNRRSVGHALVAIEEEGDEGSNNMLSEMFNYAGHADVLAAATAHESSNSNPPAGYHRLIQQIRPEFYGGGTANMINSNNWSSSIIHEDAAALAAKQHGVNTAAESSSSSSTAMRFFFMNPNQRSPTSPDHNPQQSPMGLFQHHHEQNKSSSIFEQGIRQIGPSLSLSSSLQQLEMRKAEELRGVRSQGSAAAAAFLFYNSQQQQEQQPPTVGSQSHHENQDQYQQLHIASSMYGSMSASNVLRNSKFARAAQEMLEEFCSVSRGHVRGKTISPAILSHGGGAASSSCSKDIPSLSPADRFENHRKKSKLISMLDEVERRYNHYCEQMQMVVNSFDSVMGFGAAMPYTALARKAMSRHFRCLKDAIAAQLKRTCELLGDSDGGSGSGLTKGETPKLRLIDQTLRQQRAFHQMGMMEQEAWRPQRGLPDRSVTILRAWLFEHFLSPYPSDADKHLLARKTGLSRNQVSNWFINARVRLWKPMVEDMYQEEAKEAESRLIEGHERNPSHSELLAAAPTSQQPHSPDSDAPAETVSIPSRPQLDHYERLRLEAQTQDHNASNSLIFPPPALDDEMYRRAAAARTGDLSLTLGLRHAGGNAPDTGGRFGL